MLVRAENVCQCNKSAITRYYFSVFLSFLLSFRALCFSLRGTGILHGLIIHKKIRIPNQEKIKTTFSKKLWDMYKNSNLEKTSSNFILLRKLNRIMVAKGCRMIPFWGAPSNFTQTISFTGSHFVSWSESFITVSCLQSNLSIKGASAFPEQALVFILGCFYKWLDIMVS